VQGLIGPVKRAKARKRVSSVYVWDLSRQKKKNQSCVSCCHYNVFLADDAGISQCELVPASNLGRANALTVMGAPICGEMRILRHGDTSQWERPPWTKRPESDVCGVEGGGREPWCRAMRQVWFPRPTVANSGSHPMWLTQTSQPKPRSSKRLPQRLARQDPKRPDVSGL